MNDAKVRLQKLERILEISRELTTTVAMGPLLRKIVGTAAELTDSRKASILLQDSRTGELRFLTASGDQSEKLVDIPVPIEGSIAGTVLLSGEPLIIRDARTDPRHFDQVGQKIGQEIRALLDHAAVDHADHFMLGSEIARKPDCLISRYIGAKPAN